MQKNRLHWIIFVRLEAHLNSGNAEKFVLAFIDTAWQIAQEKADKWTLC